MSIILGPLMRFARVPKTGVHWELISWLGESKSQNIGQRCDLAQPLSSNRRSDTSFSFRSLLAIWSLKLCRSSFTQTHRTARLWSLTRCIATKIRPVRQEFSPIVFLFRRLDPLLITRLGSFRGT